MSEWMNKWICCLWTIQAGLSQRQNYHSELKWEIRAGNKDLRVTSFHVVMKFRGENKFYSWKSKIAQDWRQTRNVDPVKVIQKLAQKFGAIWVVIKSSDCFTRTNWLLIFALGTPLADWWLGFCAPNAGGPGLILDPGTKILHATKHSQKKKKIPAPIPTVNWVGVRSSANQRKLSCPESE